MSVEAGMERRAWLYSLRDIRIYVFILAIISFSLVGSLIHSQPASAESFLGKTVRCVVGGLLLGADCRTPVDQTPTTPPAAEPQPANTPASNPNTNTTPSQQSVQQSTNATVTQLAPIEDVELAVDTPELPVLPSVTHRNPTQPELAGFATVNNIPGSGTLGASTLAIEPSSEGWRIFGIPWYWFGVVAAVLFAAGVWTKKRYAHTA